MKALLVALLCGYGTTVAVLLARSKIREVFLLTAALMLLIVWTLLILGRAIPDGYSLPSGKVHQHNHD
jgi:hypothetical protein